MERERIPSLDGARAISISLVIASHAMWKGAAPHILGFDYGNLGVRIFFVISGFIITRLLIQERERIGRISIAQFYLRRAFRILPAAYVCIAVMAGLLAITTQLRWRWVVPAVFYYADYQHRHYAVLGQFWSLSVEEQFYLIWPAILVFLGVPKARYACGALLVAAPLFRMLSVAGIWPTPSGSAFECVCDALATGCLLALLRDVLWSSAGYRRIVQCPMAWVVAALGVGLSCKGLPVFVRWVVGIPLLNVGIAVLLDRYMRMSHHTFMGRFLNLTPIIWIGTISYSVYLWQQPWMLSALPVAVRISCTMLCALASFYLLERRMMWLRGRIIERLVSRCDPGTVVSTERAG